MAAFMLTETVMFHKDYNIYYLALYKKWLSIPSPNICHSLEREQIFAVYHAYIQILGLLCTRFYLWQVLEPPLSLSCLSFLICVIATP